MLSSQLILVASLSGVIAVALPAAAQDPPPSPPAEGGAGPAAGAAPAAGAGPAAGAAPAPKAAAITEDLPAQLRVWSVLSASAGQIDQCTERYTTEFPSRAGQAVISVKVIEGGRVQEASASTGLPSSDRLIACLSSIGRLWRFSDGPFDINLPVPVAKGQKLKLKKPGEKDTPPAAQRGEEKKAEEPEGFIRFTPSWSE